MPVTGTVYLDLTTKYELARNRVYFELEATPDNAKVIVFAGDILPAFSIDAFRFLSNHAHRLHIDVQGDAGAVREWYRALTTGEAVAA